MKVEIIAKSPLHLGSGKADVILDAEVVHDKCGMPYFPAKRLKGLLYESAIEMAEISQEKWFTIAEINELFGHNSKAETGVVIDNFYLENYAEMYSDWQYLQEKYTALFTREIVLNSYTSVRYQTSIDKITGTTVEGSLHNMRVVDEDVKFIGEIKLLQPTAVNYKIISYALKNLRFAGAKRNRGCGKITCTILDKNEKLERAITKDTNKVNKHLKVQTTKPSYKVKAKHKKKRR